MAVVAFVRSHAPEFVKAAGTTDAYSLTSLVPAGNTLFAVCVHDNAAAANTPIVSSISKPAGETASWVLLMRNTYPSASTSGNFANGEVWMIKTTVDWPNATSLTFTYSASITMKLQNIVEFSGVEAVQKGNVGNIYSTTTTAASSSTTGTQPAIGDLAIGFAFASNSSSSLGGDTDTSGGSWSSAIQMASSSGNVSTNNAGVFQYKILTGAIHQTYNISSGATAGNGSCVAILPFTPEPVISQAAYRFYEDGPESTSTALAAQDTAATAALTTGDVNLGLRLRLQETNAGNVPVTDDWQLRWEKNNSGVWKDVVAGVPTETLLDTYPSSNYSSADSFTADSESRRGQQFMGDGSTLTRMGFRLHKSPTNVPDGVVTAALYASTSNILGQGTPTGSPLATSVTVVDPTTLPTATNSAWTYFDFSGYPLQAGTAYFAVASSTNTVMNAVFTGIDYTAPTHAGRYFSLLGSTWGSSTYDLIFEVYSVPAQPVVPYASPNLDPVVDANTTALATTFDEDLLTATFVAAQSFTAGVTGPLISASFRVKKKGAPTGTVKATLWLHSGTYGVNSLGSGNGLATSTARPVGDFTNTYDWYTFTFDGTVALTAGTRYVISIGANTVATSTDCLSVELDSAGTGHPGNMSISSNIGNWSPRGASDLLFVVRSSALATTNRLTGGLPNALCAEYASVNRDTQSNLIDTGGVTKNALPFYGNGGKVSRVRLWWNATAAGNGAVSASIWSTTGTFGIDAMPATLLATSTNSVPASSLTTTPTQYDFEFDQTLTLATGTLYAVVADTSNTVNFGSMLGMDSSTSYGNKGSYYSRSDSLWHISGSSTTVVFEVYTLSLFTSGKVSTTGLVSDLGWAKANNTEVLYALTIKADDLADADTLRFRVVRNGAALNTIAVTPTITASKVTGPPAYTASPALSGAGTLGATVLPTVTAAPALSGSGGLSASLTPRPTASASLSGSGTLGATGVVTESYATTAALSGSGGLNAGMSPGVTTTPALSGSGSLSTTTQPKTTAAPALSGSGTLSSTVLPKVPAAPALSGSGSLSTSVVPRPVTVATLSGSGSLGATTAVSGLGLAALSGSGTMAATASAATAASAAPALSGTGVLSALRQLSVAGSPVLSGSGLLSTVITVQFPGGTGFSPTTVTGCVLGLDATDVPAGAVSSWPDRSSQHNNLIPLVGAPTSSGTYVSVSTNNALSTIANLPISGNAPSHLFLWMRSRAVDGAFLGWGDASSSGLFDLWNYRGQGTLIWHGHGGSNDTVPGAPLFTPDVWHLVEVSYNGAGRIEVRVDDLPEVGARDGLALATVPNTLYLGRGRYSANGDFDLTGLFLYDRVLSGAERDGVRGYLSGAAAPVPAQLLSGEGTLSAIGSAATAASATPALSSVGTLSAASSLSQLSTATLSGSGSLNALATPRPASAATLSGTGGLGVVALPQAAAAVAFSGAGSLNSSAAPRPQTAVALNGSGTLSANGSAVVAGSSAPTLSGAGTLSTTLVASMTRAASLSGSGTLAATLTPKPVAAATLNGSGSLQTSAKADVATAVSLSGNGVLTAVGSASAAGAAAPSLIGTGTLSVTTKVAIPGGGSTFDVSTISGLATWLDADDLGLANGASVATWRDKSPAGVHLGVWDSTGTGGATTTAATYAANTLSGRGVVRFNGTSNAYTSDIQPSTYRHVFVVAKYNSATFKDYDGLITGYDGNEIIFIGTGGGTAWYSPPWGGEYRFNGELVGNRAAPMQQWGLMEISLPAGYPLTRLRIGIDRQYPPRWWDGDVAEVVIYDRVLSEPERVSVQDYLNIKWLGAPAPPQPGVTRSLTGTGTLSASSAPSTAGAAALTGSGGLSAGVVPTTTAAPVLSGAGTLAGISQPKLTVPATLSGTGSLVSTLQSAMAGVAGMAGTGSLSCTTALTAKGSPALSGTGALSAAVATSGGSSTSLAGSGTLVLSSTPRASSAPALSGAGNLAAAGNPAVPASPALTGSGVLSSSVSQAANTLATLTGAGTLSRTVTAGVSVAASLTGSGTLTSVTLPKLAAQAAFAGVGALSATTQLTQSGAAALSGSGSMTATGSGSQSGSATANFTGSGTMSATPAPGFASVVGLSGAGVLAAGGKAAIPATPALSGTGELIASLRVQLSTSVVLSGTSTLEVFTSPQVFGAPVFIGNGVLTALTYEGMPLDVDFISLKDVPVIKSVRSMRTEVVMRSSNSRVSVALANRDVMLKPTREGV